MNGLEYCRLLGIDAKITSRERVASLFLVSEIEIHEVKPQYIVGTFRVFTMPAKWAKCSGGTLNE
jgi:hypothetical protein